MIKLLGQRFDLHAQPVIWLDLERTVKDAVPVMTSVLRHTGMETYVHDPHLELAADAKGLPIIDWTACYGSLAHEALSVNALLVGYSDTELRFLQQAAPECAEDLEKRYLNANAGAWFRNNLPAIYDELYRKVRKEDPTAKPGLKDFIRHPAVGYDYPLHLRGFSPAAAINRMREQLGRKGAYTTVAPGAKRAWSKLIQYNQQDVLGMKHLVEHTVAQRSLGSGRTDGAD
jgi:hypothetical protein